MKPFLRILACSVALSFPLSFAACNTQEKTEELIQARLDAEKVKDQQVQIQELKSVNEQQKKENESLKLELTTLQSKLAMSTTASRVASRQVGTKRGGTPDSSPATPAEVKALHDELTGGSSFK